MKGGTAKASSVATAGTAVLRYVQCRAGGPGGWGAVWGVGGRGACG